MMNLASEIICGYEVSAKVKRLWSLELDLVKHFIEVCTQFNLRYQITGGTLLGAVRHKGFIPWDNDIDIVMPREDYDKFLGIGKDAFKYPYFFQSPETENGRYFERYVKVRNTCSTASSQVFFDKGINCGVFIDIFCLDELPDNRYVRRLFYWELNEIAKMQRFCFDTPLKKNCKHWLQRIVYRFILHRPDAAELFRLFNRKAGRFSGRNCRQVTTLEFGFRENVIWNKSDWNDVVLLDFEDMHLAAPAGYDAVLKKQYGDYMRIPENKSTHDYLVFDPDTPYEEFFMSDRY